MIRYRGVSEFPSSDLGMGAGVLGGTCSPSVLGEFLFESSAHRRTLGTAKHSPNKGGTEEQIHGDHVHSSFCHSPMPGLDPSSGQPQKVLCTLLQKFPCLKDSFLSLCPLSLPETSGTHSHTLCQWLRWAGGGGLPHSCCTRLAVVARRWGASPLLLHTSLAVDQVESKGG